MAHDDPTLLRVAVEKEPYSYRVTLECGGALPCVMFMTDEADQRAAVLSAIGRQFAESLRASLDVTAPGAMDPDEVIVTQQMTDAGVWALQFLPAEGEDSVVASIFREMLRASRMREADCRPGSSSEAT